MATLRAPSGTKTADKANDNLIRPLFEGKIDVIGDIHGEAGALTTLLDRLGYDGFGRHADGRRLVFVGDLVDRGPNSVAVCDVVRGLVESGNAQMVLGNHELNLLLGKHKHGNHWFYGETEVIRKDQKQKSYQVLAPSEEWRKKTLDFFRSQPVILERKDVIVVHAAILPESLKALREWDDTKGKEGGAGSGCVLGAYKHFADIAAKKIENLKEKGRKEGEEEEDEVKIQIELTAQNCNPIKAPIPNHISRILSAEHRWYPPSPSLSP
eukprot:jgi/Bigna1/145207/aug1.96_g19915